MVYVDGEEDLRAAFSGRIGAWLAWLGVVAGVMAAISALVRVLEVGLMPILQDFLEFYRKLFGPIYQLVEKIPLPFTVTPTQFDVVILYIVCLSLSYRAEMSAYTRNRRFQIIRLRIESDLISKIRHEDDRDPNDVGRAIGEQAGSAARRRIYSLEYRIGSFLRSALLIGLWTFLPFRTLPSGFDRVVKRILREAPTSNTSSSREDLVKSVDALNASIKIDVEKYRNVFEYIDERIVVDSRYKVNREELANVMSAAKAEFGLDNETCTEITKKWIGDALLKSADSLERETNEIISSSKEQREKSAQIVSDAYAKIKNRLRRERANAILQLVTLPVAVVVFFVLNTMRPV